MTKQMWTTEDLGSFCLSLCHLIHGGLGTADALALLAEDEAQPARRALLKQMADTADEGLPLDKVLEQTGAFPGYLSALTAVGRQTGRLEEALLALANYYENRTAMEKQIRAAVVYPAVLGCVLLAVIFILLIWVLPVFDRAYRQLGSGLSGIAGVLLTLGGVLKALLPLLGILLALALCTGLVLWRSERGRSKAAALAARLMGDRGPALAVNRARFMQALSMCLQAGFSPEEAVVRAMLPVGETSPFRQRCDRCAILLERGATLPAALRESEVLSRSDCRLLEAGFRGGSGEQVTETVARRLLSDSEHALEACAARVEPALVLALAVLVGGILLSVMLPLLDVMSAIG